VEIVYRYDLSKYLDKMKDAYVEDQVVEIPYKSKVYTFTIGWPNVRTISILNHHFYSEIGEITEEMERTQLGIDFVLSFVKKVVVKDAMT
jgi:hypothetical protein